ncbi:hypothetical protein [Nostoc sp. ATCC 53789]|uniref:hypothetical protein n=1 Tax=Nostoc sp. ATCC 53789 TaxID=76335 RepID=UPI000DEC13B3|nr:hypothetical protein [Nostoc sp. ATCC 53789]QHG15812.1 hypothetical protein GJB62_07400 [Nostoc sp. ATCC 53789]RCJ27748.1 hypothetical protein A6V25_17770 [Nostoc sp. ATCC 53789]
MVITPAPPPDDKLPDNFDPFEHLQKIYIPQHNAIVNRYFSDLGDDWKPNIASARSALRVACTMVDNDNQLMMSLRHHLLFDLLGYSKKNLAIFYGSSLDTALPVSGHPQLFLYFSQDSQAVPVNGKRLDHEKSCRLTRYASKAGQALPAITKANLIEIAREIKTQFVEGKKGLVYTSGKISVSYTDPPNGFPRGGRWLVNSKSEAISLYQKLCNIVDRPFDLNKINVITPEKDSSTQASTQTETILGKQYKEPAYRPVANLRFRYAYVSFGGSASPIFLIDTTFRNTALIA